MVVVVSSASATALRTLLLGGRRCLLPFRPSSSSSRLSGSLTTLGAASPPTSTSTSSIVAPPTFASSSSSSSPPPSASIRLQNGTFSSTTRAFSTDGSVTKAGEEASVWDKADLKRIFDGNNAWRAKFLNENPDHFKDQAKGQSPEYLVIGCSDSRVGAQTLMGMNQGELFVARNIANVVVPTDINLLSVLFYSVNVLKVKDIIVMGHYECGGIRAASENKDLGLIEHWLRNIRDVRRLHKDELDAIEDGEERHRRLVELNVQEQCFNVFTNSIVQQMQAKTGRPRVHGMVYDIANGKLKYLDIDFRDELRRYKDIYSLADFRRLNPISIHDLVVGETAEEKCRETDRLVVVQSPDEKTMKPIRCAGTTTVRQVKEAIKILVGIPVAQQNLFIQGRQLKDDDLSLDDAGIDHIAEVELRENIVPLAFKLGKPSE